MHAMSTNRRVFLGTLSGFAAGFVGAMLLHSYPKDVVTRHRYCLVCAEYEETYRESVILGARTDSKSRFGGPLQRLLAPAVGEHEHRYTEWATIFPTFGVPEEHPEIAEKIRAIRELDESPQAISALEQAMRQDPQRTIRLIQRLIDPAEGLSITVIMPLQNHQLGWDERWARVEKKLAEPSK
jgi:hypothetical protein